MRVPPAGSGGEKPPLGMAHDQGLDAPQASPSLDDLSADSLDETPSSFAVQRTVSDSAASGTQEVLDIGYCRVVQLPSHLSSPSGAGAGSGSVETVCMGPAQLLLIPSNPGDDGAQLVLCVDQADEGTGNEGDDGALWYPFLPGAPVLLDAPRCCMKAPTYVEDGAVYGFLPVDDSTQALKTLEALACELAKYGCVVVRREAGDEFYEVPSGQKVEGIGEITRSVSGQSEASEIAHKTSEAVSEAIKMASGFLSSAFGKAADHARRSSRALAHKEKTLAAKRHIRRTKGSRKKLPLTSGNRTFAPDSQTSLSAQSVTVQGTTATMTPSAEFLGLTSGNRTSAPDSLTSRPAQSVTVQGATATRTFHSAEEFLGRPIELLRPPADASCSDVSLAKWLLDQRRAEAALKALEAQGCSSTVEICILRTRCYVALRRYPLATEELQQCRYLLSGEDMPMAARILSAQMPLLSNPSDPLIAMGLLLELSRAMRQPSSDATCVQVLLSEKLHILNLLSHAALAAGHSEVASLEFRTAAEATSGDDAALIFAALGRHFVEMGNAPAAKRAFVQAAESEQYRGTATALFDAGMCLVAGGENDKAIAKFELALERALQDFDSLAECEGPWVSCVDEVVAAANNLAVCQFAARKLTVAIDCCEAIVRRNPVLFLKQSVAKNLSSLYEFLPDPRIHRQPLRELFEAFQLDDIDPQSAEV